MSVRASIDDTCAVALWCVIVWRLQTWVHAVLNHEFVLIFRLIYTQGLSAQGDNGVSG